MVTLIAGWMICLFIIDIYWLVMPVVPEGPLAEATSYDELSAMVSSGEVGWLVIERYRLHPALSMISLLVSGTMFNLRKCLLVPAADPRLEESLSFENLIRTHGHYDHNTPLINSPGTLKTSECRPGCSVR